MPSRGYQNPYSISPMPYAQDQEYLDEYGYPSYPGLHRPQQPHHNHQQQRYCDQLDETYYSGESVSEDDFPRHDRKPHPHRRRSHSTQLLSPNPSYSRHSTAMSPCSNPCRLNCLGDDNFIYPEKPIRVDIQIIENGYPVNRIQANMGEMSIRDMRRGIFRNPAYGIHQGAKLMIKAHGEELDSKQLDPHESVRSLIGRTGRLRGAIYQGHAGHRQPGSMRLLAY